MLATLFHKFTSQSWKLTCTITSKQKNDRDNKYYFLSSNFSSAYLNASAEELITTRFFSPEGMSCSKNSKQPNEKITKRAVLHNAVFVGCIVLSRWCSISLEITRLQPVMSAVLLFIPLLIARLYSLIIYNALCQNNAGDNLNMN